MILDPKLISGVAPCALLAASLMLAGTVDTAKAQQITGTPGSPMG